MKNLPLTVICFSLAIVNGQPEQNQGSWGPNQIGSVDNQGIRNYLLGPGNLFCVFGQPDLNAIAEVDSEGNISSLPFLGRPFAPAAARRATKKILLRPTQST